MIAEQKPTKGFIGKPKRKPTNDLERWLYSLPTVLITKSTPLCHDARTELGWERAASKVAEALASIDGSEANRLQCRIADLDARAATFTLVAAEADDATAAATKAATKAAKNAKRQADSLRPALQHAKAVLAQRRASARNAAAQSLDADARQRLQRLTEEAVLAVLAVMPEVSELHGTLERLNAERPVAFSRR